LEYPNPTPTSALVIDVQQWIDTRVPVKIPCSLKKSLGSSDSLFLCFSVTPYIDGNRYRLTVAQLRDITIEALGDKSSLYIINKTKVPVLIFMSFIKEVAHNGK
jgi:hypothetical protein